MGLLGFSGGPTGIHVWSAQVGFATLLERDGASLNPTPLLVLQEPRKASA
jgi:hypothetical protein